MAIYSVTLGAGGDTTTRVRMAERMTEMKRQMEEEDGMPEVDDMQVDDVDDQHDGSRWDLDRLQPDDMDVSSTRMGAYWIKNVSVATANADYESSDTTEVQMRMYSKSSEIAFVYNDRAATSASRWQGAEQDVRFSLSLVHRVWKSSEDTLNFILAERPMCRISTANRGWSPVNNTPFCADLQSDSPHVSVTGAADKIEVCYNEIKRQWEGELMTRTMRRLMARVTQA